MTESETDAADTVEESEDYEETVSQIFGPLKPVDTVKASTTAVSQIDSA